MTFITAPCKMIWMFTFTNWCVYLFVLQSTKIYLKFAIKCSYMFRSTTINRELVL